VGGNGYCTVEESRYTGSCDMAQNDSSDEMCNIFDSNSLCWITDLKRRYGMFSGGLLGYSGVQLDRLQECNSDEISSNFNYS
jgi:hypothetical protein